MTHVLEVDKLFTGYGKSVIIQNVSMVIGNQEIISIIGPNGSGKSTLLKCIVGILRAFSGSISYLGREITNTKSHQLTAMGIGYVPQLDNIFTNLTVEENLEMGAYLIRDKNTVRSSLNEIFELFSELKSFRHRKAGTLSGGERQILAIARAMMMKPKLLILDEPTANLSPKVISKIHKKILEINKYGTSILMAEQNVKAAIKIAGRVYVLVSGACVYEGGVEEVSDETKLGKLFFKTV